MTNFLNLDELAPAKKTFTLKGNTFDVPFMTVGEFIEKQKNAKVVEDAKTPGEQAERAIEQIKDAVPDITVDLLKNLSVAQLVALLNFILAAPEDVAQDAAEDADAGK